jgi:hypothetical protein
MTTNEYRWANETPSLFDVGEVPRPRARFVWRNNSGRIYESVECPRRAVLRWQWEYERWVYPDSGSVTFEQFVFEHNSRRPCGEKDWIRRECHGCICSAD